MALKNKPVMVIESRDFKIEKKTKDSAGFYILEGIFAEFDIVNNNNRIYEAETYLPHLTYLNQKINERRLFGELDHPEKFDISLNKVSHLVEKIWFDESSKTVRGRIKLIDTDSGKNAQAIVDAGATLSISSRAAGTVNESTRKVDIKRIFTYDLVADPGMPNSKMVLINEKLGINESNIGIYEITEEFIKKEKSQIAQFLMEMTNSDNGFNENEVENLKENNFKYIKKENNTTVDMTKHKSNDPVTMDTLSNYSKHIKTAFNNLKDSIDNGKNSKIYEQVAKLEKNFTNLTEYADSLVDDFNTNESRVDKLEKYVQYQTNKINELSGKVSEKIENLEESYSQLEKMKGDIIKFTNYLAEKLNYSINNSDNIVEGYKKLVEYNNYLAESLNKSIGHGDHLSESVKKIISFNNKTFERIEKYLDYIGGNLDESLQHQDYVATKLNEAINFANYTAKNLDTAIGYMEYGLENSAPSLPTSTKGVNESVALSDQIDVVNKFILGFKNEKDKLNEEIKIKSLLPPTKALELQLLPEADKRKVFNAILERGAINESEILDIWEQVLTTPEKTRRNLLLKHIPDSIKPIWETLTEAQKSVYEVRAKNWDLSNPISIRNFWLNQDFPIAEKTKSTQLLESAANSDFYKNVINSATAQNANKATKLGYSANDVKSLIGSLKK